MAYAQLAKAAIEAGASIANTVIGTKSAEKIVKSQTLHLWHEAFIHYKMSQDFLAYCKEYIEPLNELIARYAIIEKQYADAMKPLISAVDLELAKFELQFRRVRFYATLIESHGYDLGQMEMIRDYEKVIDESRGFINDALRKVEELEEP